MRTEPGSNRSFERREKRGRYVGAAGWSWVRWALRVRMSESVRGPAGGGGEEMTRAVDE